MGKLIDADLMIKNIDKQIKELPGDDDWAKELTVAISEKIKKFINEQPTAFDVDKVVAELEFRKSYLNHNGLVVSVPVVTFENAVEIVKKGGVT